MPVTTDTPRKRIAYIHVRVTPEQRAAVIAEAQRLGVSESVVVRRVLNQHFPS